MGAHVAVHKWITSSIMSHMHIKVLRKGRLDRIEAICGVHKRDSIEMYSFYAWNFDIHRQWTCGMSCLSSSLAVHSSSTNPVVGFNIHPRHYHRYRITKTHWRVCTISQLLSPSPSCRLSQEISMTFLTQWWCSCDDDVVICESSMGKPRIIPMLMFCYRCTSMYSKRHRKQIDECLV